ncbi:SH3 domain-containing protein [Kockovaella imperatae]|uniref:SH3 domain-containing protein n=1 Tax=Kockovaella imperatae TaxID=4999 RepID=A0A1Y1UCL2_9TREE|nr:SH3 domain-containing protein [Kockovaella imperatae]ORX35749.1 SH3 domain-containing protein [Kockovaella imperatae]
MSNMDSPGHSLTSHLINQTLSSIAILESLNIVSAADAHLIRQKLPPASGPFPALDSQGPTHPQSSVSNLPGSFSSLNLNNPPSSPHDYRSPQAPLPSSQSQQFSQTPSSPYPPPALPPRGRATESRARALWDYNGTAHDDLTFRSGDTVIIDEEVNEQWYRGRVIPQGQQYPLERSGLFPSNYIEKLAPQNMYSSPPPPPPQSHMVPYQGPGPMQQYGYDKPGQHMMPPPPHQMMAQPSSGPPTYVVQQEEHKKGRFGKMGGTIGTAFVTGAGWGAGSAVASEVVHAIL